tara:strand:+ start:278 stop:559 length:282 start_codon:yes stop_codon:yes gene_type:complete
MSTILSKLEAQLKARQTDLPEGSYATKLFKEGIDRILRKVGEEAGELIIAAKNNNKDEICNETADLLFHMMMTLREREIDFSEVLAVLEARHH